MVVVLLDPIMVNFSPFDPVGSLGWVLSWKSTSVMSKMYHFSSARKKMRLFPIISSHRFPNPFLTPVILFFWYYLHWGMIWVLGAREQRRIFACGSSSHQGFGARFFLANTPDEFWNQCWCMIWTWNKKKETWISSSSIKSEMCHPKSAFPFSEKLLVAHSRELL